MRAFIQKYTVKSVTLDLSVWRTLEETHNSYWMLLGIFGTFHHCVANAAPLKTSAVAPNGHTPSWQDVTAPDVFGHFKLSPILGFLLKWWRLMRPLPCKRDLQGFGMISDVEIWRFMTGWYLTLKFEGSWQDDIRRWDLKVHEWTGGWYHTWDLKVHGWFCCGPKWCEEESQTHINTTCCKQLVLKCQHAGSQKRNKCAGSDWSHMYIYNYIYTHTKLYVCIYIYVCHSLSSSSWSLQCT